VKLKPFKRAPVLIAFSVILLLCLLHLSRPEWLERVEGMTYDARAKLALRYAPSAATNLGFVYIDEESVKAVADGSLGYRFGLSWPRQVHGRLVRELREQGAKAIGFDILFGELRPDHPPVRMADDRLVDSDDFLAQEMRRASNVILAVEGDLIIPPLFLTNAAEVGGVTTEKDPDGILRRVQVYRSFTNWHRAFRQLAADPEVGIDLKLGRIETNCVVLPRGTNEAVVFPLDAEGNFDLADFVGDRIPKGMVRKNKPFVVKPVWDMGVVLAARDLGLDLARAEVDLARGRITLRGASGLTRTLPVDREGYCYIDWGLTPEDRRLQRESIQSLLLQNRLRMEHKTEGLSNRWQGKLVVVGSAAVVGNNLTDRGATPISKDTLLVSKHWNVANSVILNRFVKRSPIALELAITIALGVLAAMVSWELPVLASSALVALGCLLYGAAAAAVYVQSRIWIPVVLPVGGAWVGSYVALMAWRVVFEQAERRRVKSIFSSMVSPKIMDELLDAEMLKLGGIRREITVLFADVRGFTEFTDQAQERVEEYVRRHGLSGEEAERCYDAQADETLRTVNTYLGLVADTIRTQDATLDKFIGDCVMAFWGAPTPNPKHATACVRAAIAAQRAIHELNLRRAGENRTIEQDNQARVAAGQEPLALKPLLQLGTGINSGMATVGLMGSESESGASQYNYTVFGREVNLASRLEGLSGRGRIFISEATYRHLLRDAPELAATCVPQPPAKVKGISAAVNVFEVPWLPPGAAQPSLPATPDTSSFVKH
jgi:adenylate cyclase